MPLVRRFDFAAAGAMVPMSGGFRWWGKVSGGRGLTGSIRVRVWSLLPLSEEVCAVFAADAGDDFDVAPALLVEGLAGDVEFVETGGVGVFDGGAVVDGVEVCPVDGGGAHWAWFAGGGHHESGEVDFVEFFAGASQAVDFGVCGDVAGLSYDVVGGVDEFAFGCCDGCSEG